MCNDCTVFRGLRKGVQRGPSVEYEIWADDLYARLSQPHALPAYASPV